MPIDIVRRELKNARMYFIPRGRTVDGVTISLTTWPDSTPATNYSDNEFGDIETVNQELDIETEAFMIAKPAGGYFKDEEKNAVARRWKCVSHKTNELLKQLEHCVPETVVIGEAQAPLTMVDPFRVGVLLIEIQGRADGGAVIERTQVWAKLRLVSAGEVGPATSKLEFTFEQMESGNNTFVVPA